MHLIPRHVARLTVWTLAANYACGGGRVAAQSDERVTLRVDGRSVLRIGSTDELEALGRVARTERRTATLLEQPDALRPPRVERSRTLPDERLITVGGVSVMTVTTAEDNVTSIDDLANNGPRRCTTVACVGTEPCVANPGAPRTEDYGYGMQQFQDYFDANFPNPSFIRLLSYAVSSAMLKPHTRSGCQERERAWLGDPANIQHPDPGGCRRKEASAVAAKRHDAMCKWGAACNVLPDPNARSLQKCWYLMR